MKTTVILILLAISCLSQAWIRDTRKDAPVGQVLSQQEVARQQALQRQQSQVGGVPQKTDDSGYATSNPSDSEAAAVVARHDVSPAQPADEVIRKNGEERSAEAAKPRQAAFGAFWALFAGLLLAFGVWAGLNKFGPKPPGHR